MLIITCQCGAQVEARRRSKKWCTGCWNDRCQAWHRARQRRYYARHRVKENERTRRWRTANHLAVARQEALRHV
jgi:hypothetical protein